MSMQTGHVQGVAQTTVISEGPASKYGKAATALLAVVAAVTAVLHGDHSTETLAAGAAAVVTLVTYMAGRYAQAVAILRATRAAAGSQAQIDAR